MSSWQLWLLSVVVVVNTTLATCSNEDPDIVDTEQCGDSVRQGEEVCDGQDLGDKTCESQGLLEGRLLSGTLAYLTDCSGLDLGGWLDLCDTIMDCDKEPPMLSGWQFHVIDDSGSGADGVNLGDVDGDGNLDITTGWEESGWVKVYFYPGADKADLPWPAVDVKGELALTDAEDAEFADLDADGIIDAVVSSCDNPCRRVGIHWITDRRNMTLPSAWTGTWVDPNTNGMFLKARVGQIDGVHGKDVVAGSKTKDGTRGQLFWFQSPPDPGVHNADQWLTFVISQIGWPKNIHIVDMDHDGDNDVLISDGQLKWFVNPGPSQVQQDRPWDSVIIDPGAGYFSVCDLDQDGTDDLVAGTGGLNQPVYARWYKRLDDSGTQWIKHDIVVEAGLPPKDSDEYTLKGVACGDLNGDGAMDLALSASGKGNGIFWLSYRGSNPAYNGVWDWHRVLDVSVMKFDNIAIMDIDNDGDLDLVATDENGGLLKRGWGILWFENPLL